MTYDSDEDSSDAPESVQFSASKSIALQQASSASDELKQRRQKLKARRQQQQAANIEQKKKKLDCLQRNRLPDDMLEAISNKPVTEKTAKAAATRTEGVIEQAEPIKTDSTASNERTDTEVAATEDAITADFIPLSTSKEKRVKAVRLADELKSIRTSAEKFANFKTNSLYGGRIRRAPSHKLQQSLIEKRRFLRK